jgi:putative membrane protein
MIVMKKIFALVFMAAALWACNDTGTGSDTDDTSTNVTDTTTMNSNVLDDDDRTFINDAAIAGMMEVEAGKIAQKKGMNASVKSFGEMMVNDHTKAGNELKSLASSKNAMLPDSLPADDRKHLDDMNKMTGKKFDEHYMKMMVDDHQDVIDKFEKISNRSKNADLKSWADKTLPTLRTHLDSAKAVKDRID